ncbi:MAG: hypothetical protein K0S80_3765 [Neobacillus sp.]|nr:hypothetical protein [Neobacillus sp.]
MKFNGIQIPLKKQNYWYYDGLKSLYLDQLLGNVKIDLVEGLGKHIDKEASFIIYIYLLTKSYFLK